MEYPELEDTLYRGKRSHKYLPTVYDDLWIGNSKSWKDRKGKKRKQFNQNKRQLKEIWFDGTSWEQYSAFYDELVNKGLYFEVQYGWWSKPAIDRKYHICWWE